MRSILVFLIFVFCAISTFFVSCNNEDNSKVSQINDSVCESKEIKIDTISNSMQIEFEKTFEDIRKTLKGAAITEPIKYIKTFYFSNSATKDTFLLSVPFGLIADTKSILSIITTEGNIIYSDSLNTDYLVQGIFYPDSIPKNISSEEQSKFLTDYLNFITREKIENYTNKQISVFFDSVFVDKAEINTPEMEENINDKELFKEVISSKDTRVICLPCFNCDEGMDYIGYSMKKKKTVAILSMD